MTDPRRKIDRKFQEYQDRHDAKAGDSFDTLIKIVMAVTVLFCFVAAWR